MNSNSFHTHPLKMGILARIFYHFKAIEMLLCLKSKRSMSSSSDVQQSSGGLNFFSILHSVCKYITNNQFFIFLPFLPAPHVHVQTLQSNSELWVSLGPCIVGCMHWQLLMSFVWIRSLINCFRTFCKFVPTTTVNNLYPSACRYSFLFFDIAKYVSRIIFHFIYCVYKHFL